MKVLTAIAGIAAIAAFTAQSADIARVSQLQWLSGCWGYSSGGSSYEEIWLPPTQNSMLGLSRRVSEDGYTRSFEFLRIVTSGGGGFDYVAQPGGNPPTRFTALDIKPNRIVFDNPLHDFPKKIIYEFRAPDQLHARIEGLEKGQPASLNFPMQRKPCEPLNSPNP